MCCIEKDIALSAIGAEHTRKRLDEAKSMNDEQRRGRERMWEMRLDVVCVSVHEKKYRECKNEDRKMG